MIDKAEKKTRIALVNDQTDVAANPHRPEILIFRLIELVEAESRTCRVQLQVEGCALDQLLFLAGELGEAVCESVGNADVRGHLYLFISIYTGNR